MKSTITISASLLTILAACAFSTNAFQASPTTTIRHDSRRFFSSPSSRQSNTIIINGNHRRVSTTTTKLAAIGPEHVHGLHSLLLSDSAFSTLLADAAQATLDLSTSSSSGAEDSVLSSLMDAVQAATSSNAAISNDDGSAASAAASAVQTAVEEAAKSDDGGWWRAYLNLFKTSLVAIHNKVDEPLRNAGIEQTWGISIAIFTATVRSLLIPLSLQQSKSAEYVKALKPYMTEIKEKFKDNKDQQNRAIAKLYEDAEQNPLAGCLVSLVQLPIFLGLYRSIRLLAQDGKLEEPFLWIPSLEGPVSPPDYRGLDWLTTGWSNVDGLLTPQLGWETTLAFLIMPVILVLGQALSMQVLQPPMDDNMSEEEKEQLQKTQVILKFLPLLIGFFSLQVPAGLTIYWFTSNTFTLLQSLTVKAYYKAYPPKIELPDYWDALDNLDTMTPEEKRAAAQAGISVGPKFSDLVEEASFHVLVERKPLREGSAAWERVSKKEEIVVPTQLESWVGTNKITNKATNTSDLELAAEAL